MEENRGRYVILKSFQSQNLIRYSTALEVQSVRSLVSVWFQASGFRSPTAQLCRSIHHEVNSRSPITGPAQIGTSILISMKFRKNLSLGPSQCFNDVGQLRAAAGSISRAGQCAAGCRDAAWGFLVRRIVVTLRPRALHPCCRTCSSGSGPWLARLGCQALGLFAPGPRR